MSDTKERGCLVVPIRVGQRHPSWPRHLRAGMFVWFNGWEPDEDPAGRLWGAVKGGARDGQPAYLPVGEDPRDGLGHNFKVTHPMFLLPGPRSKQAVAETGYRRILNGSERSNDACA